MAARTVNYTGGEKSLLVDLVQKYHLFVENKRTDACTTKVIVPFTEGWRYYQFGTDNINLYQSGPTIRAHLLTPYRTPYRVQQNTLLQCIFHKQQINYYYLQRQRDTSWSISHCYCYVPSFSLISYNWFVYAGKRLKVQCKLTRRN